MKNNILLSRLAGLLLLCLYLPQGSSGQSPAHNYLTVQQYRDTLRLSSVRDVRYEDGFGRTLREVGINATPDATGDLIRPFAYGCFGRTERTYLPYVRFGNAGGYDSLAFEPDNWSHYGAADQGYAFQLTLYDNSPLELVTGETGSGRAWQTAGKSRSCAYGTNAAEEVRIWRVNANGSLQAGGYYPAGSLQRVSIGDEDGGITITYTDRSGRQVLSVRVDGVQRYETYRVYDGQGLLCCVLPPQFLAEIDAGGNIADAVQQYAYVYVYDAWGRPVEKKLPGSEPVYNVYDNRDRLAASQDGNLRLAGMWNYTLYDGQNRPVESGWMEEGKTQEQLQEALEDDGDYIRKHIRIPLQYTVYDGYETAGSVVAHPFAASHGYASGYRQGAGGRITSVKTRIVGTDTWQTSTLYYDGQGRVIQTVSDNRLGGLSRTEMKYDFADHLLQQRESHSKGNGNADVLEWANTYDLRGRLLTQSISLNGGEAATMTLQYDALGRLVNKRYGNVSENLAYNIRGWLTDKESTLFRMALRYEAPQGDATPCYNGKISEWEWQQGNSAARMYGFAYDALGRFTQAIEKQKTGNGWTLSTAGYTEKGLHYDRNGNILGLQRTAAGNLVDHLIYNYTGNRLTGLTEQVRTAATGDVYAPGTEASGTYEYDANGNLINDSRRSLIFGYNFLNLLNEVRRGNEPVAYYTWLADGTKLGVTDGSGTNGFEYVGSLIYRRTGSGLQLSEAQFGEGMIRIGEDGGQEVDYFLTDHLGSVRVVVDSQGEVRERNDYYPLGARHIYSEVDQTVSRWKFNGKEEQITGDLGYLDYGARMYDAALGKWMTVDPMAENYYDLSSYTYCGGDPVRLIDPDGCRLDNYQLMPGGRIEFLEKTDDPYDVLYASNSDKKGDIDESRYVKVNDKTILSVFTEPRRKNWQNGFTYTSNAEDAFNLFDFVVRNSSAEWGLDGYKDKGNFSFRLRTSFDEKTINYINDPRELNMYATIHSHPKIKEASGYEEGNMSGDKRRIELRSELFLSHGKQTMPRHYVYHKLSRGLYYYTPTNSGIFIRKMNSIADYKKIFNIK